MSSQAGEGMGSSGFLLVTDSKRPGRESAQAGVFVPFLGEFGAAFKESLPVGRHQQSELVERFTARRRSCSRAPRMEKKIFGHRLLAEIGEEPVDVELGGVGVRASGGHAPGLR